MKKSEFAKIEDLLTASEHLTANIDIEDVESELQMELPEELNKDDIDKLEQEFIDHIVTKLAEETNLVDLYWDMLNFISTIENDYPDLELELEDTFWDTCRDFLTSGEVD